MSNTVRIWFDTEFIERGAGYPIDLISIGLVDDRDREFYAECRDFDESLANDWVREHVLAQLVTPPDKRLARANIARSLLDWIGSRRPEFWAYYADYDWVVLCQLFGTMVDLPHGWPMFCHDLKQLCVERGDPPLPATDEHEHNALTDARWCKQAWLALGDPLWLVGSVE